MIGVIDSNISNLSSITNMLKKLNADFIVIKKSKEFDKVDKLILPGVGAFPKGMENLIKLNFLEKIIEAYKNGKIILGICLGMQLLFSESKEFSTTKGIDLIPGVIEKINTKKVLPHMGWNDIKVLKDIPLLNGVKEGANFYFVHSYKVNTNEKYVAAVTEYDELIPAVIFKENIFGTQFHPEKSQIWGEVVLKNFINL